MSERGSALVMAIVVMVVLTFLGVTLLGLCQYEARMSLADARRKAVFYIAEAGLEHARKTLLDADAASASPGSVDDELANAAGADDTFDFDPATVRPVYDANGRVTGFTGYGDDLPLQAFTPFAGGGYAAFLSNDGIDESLDPLDDTNNRVVLSAVGAGPGSTVEVVQALVQRVTMPLPPAAITMPGPDPVFEAGFSNAQLLSGDDCEGNGEPGLSVPVVAVIGADAEADAEQGVHQASTFVSGPDTGVDTVTDVESTILPLWKDCDYLTFLADQIRAGADVVGDESTPESALGTVANPKTVYIDGDYELSNALQGAGTLWVTGTLTIHGGTDWQGAVYAVGRGVVKREGAGAGLLSGGFVVADVDGQDGVLGTADDCLGADGLPGTGDDGFEPGTFTITGGGTGTVVYCKEHLEQADGSPFTVVQFRQR